MSLQHIWLFSLQRLYMFCKNFLESLCNFCHYLKDHLFSLIFLFFVMITGHVQECCRFLLQKPIISLSMLAVLFLYPPFFCPLNHVCTSVMNSFTRHCSLDFLMCICFLLAHGLSYFSLKIFFSSSSLQAVLIITDVLQCNMQYTGGDLQFTYFARNLIFSN